MARGQASARAQPSGMGAPNSPIADVEPPAERQDLTHAGTGTERGKPVGLPRSVRPYKAGRTRGKRAARDAEGPAGRGWWKKRRPVCNGPDRGRTGECAVRAVERYITPRESGLTSTWSLVTREFGKPLSRGKADDGGLRPSWCALWCDESPRGGSKLVS